MIEWIMRGSVYARTLNYRLVRAYIRTRMRSRRALVDLRFGLKDRAPNKRERGRRGARYKSVGKDMSGGIGGGRPLLIGLSRGAPCG